MTGRWIPHDTRDSIVDYMKHWSARAELPTKCLRLERFPGTLEAEGIRPSCPETIEKAKRKVERFVRYYNHVRLHSAIG